MTTFLMFFGFLMFLAVMAYLNDRPEKGPEYPDFTPAPYHPSVYVKPDLTRGGVVYQATNIMTGKKYIGLTRQGVDARWFGHCHSAIHSQNHKSNSKFHRAIRKYGEDNFFVQVVAEADTGAELCRLEARLIRSNNTVKAGYNTMQPRDDLV